MDDFSKRPTKKMTDPQKLEMLFNSGMMDPTYAPELWRAAQRDNKGQLLRKLFVWWVDCFVDRPEEDLKVWLTSGGLGGQVASGTLSVVKGWCKGVDISFEPITALQAKGPFVYAHNAGVIRTDITGMTYPGSRFPSPYWDQENTLQVDLKDHPYWTLLDAEIPPGRAPEEVILWRRAQSSVYFREYLRPKSMIHKLKVRYLPPDKYEEDQEGE